MKKSIAIFGLFLMMVSLTSFTSPIGGRQDSPTLPFEIGGRQDSPTLPFEIGGRQDSPTLP